MKKIVTMLSFIISTSTFSGEIVNKKTNERIIFTVDKQSEIVVIESRLFSGINTMNMPLEVYDEETAKRKFSNVDLGDISVPFSASRGFLFKNDYSRASYLFLPFTLIIDIMSLPITATFSISDQNSLRNMNRKYKLLKKIIFTSESVEISNKRFKSLVMNLSFFRNRSLNY